MRKLVSLILVLGLLLGVAMAEIEALETVELHREASSASEVVASVEAGTLLEDLDCIMYDETDAGWYWVKLDGEECWIPCAAARATEQGEGAPLDDEDDWVRSARFGIARIYGEDRLTIEEMVWITPEDTELIERYGLEADLGGSDYEFVPLDGTRLVYRLGEEVIFRLLDPESEYVLNMDADAESFMQRLRECGEEGTYVNYSCALDHADLLERIEETYIP